MAKRRSQATRWNYKSARSLNLILNSLNLNQLVDCTRRARVLAETAYSSYLDLRDVTLGQVMTLHTRNCTSTAIVNVYSTEIFGQTAADSGRVLILLLIHPRHNNYAWC